MLMLNEIQSSIVLLFGPNRPIFLNIIIIIILCHSWLQCLLARVRRFPKMALLLHTFWCWCMCFNGRMPSLTSTLPTLYTSLQGLTTTYNLRTLNFVGARLHVSVMVEKVPVGIFSR